MAHGRDRAATEGVANVVQFPGLNAIHFVNTPNAGVMFIGIDAAGRIAQARPRSPASSTASSAPSRTAWPSPAAAAGARPGQCRGRRGLSCRTAQRLGYGELNRRRRLSPARSRHAGLRSRLGTFSSFQANVPQLDATVDRIKAKEQGLALTDVYDRAAGLPGLGLRQRLQPVRPHLQRVRAGRRALPRRGERRRAAAGAQRPGEMVPLGSVVELKPSFGPDPVIRYNGYPAADVSRRHQPGGDVLQQAIGAMATMPTGAAARHAARVDRPDLPAGHPGHRGSAGVPAVRAAGLPGAGRAVRELVAAAGGDPDRADVPALGHRRHLAAEHRQRPVVRPAARHGLDPDDRPACRRPSSTTTSSPRSASWC
jgi:multidrug efflux pump subunit AcrB